MTGNPIDRWPLERFAGTVALVSAALTVIVSGWFVLLTAFVGVNQRLYVTVGACPASIVLRRAFGLRSAIYEDRDRALARTEKEVAV